MDRRSRRPPSCALTLALSLVALSAAPAGAAPAAAPPAIVLPQAPSPAAPRIAILTMTPGTNPFERFGHTAIRVDGAAPEPLVYNYGTFDVADPHIVGKFLRHRLPYWLSVTTWRETEDRYARRRITLQWLALSDDEAHDMAAFLANNALPQNREYVYEFFRDNCATRVRDAVERATRSVRATAEKRPGVATFRQHVRTVLAAAPVYRRAIDLVLNERVDEPITRWDDAFLPHELMTLLDESRRPIDGDGGRPLVAAREVWTGPRFNPAEIDPSARPLDIALLIALLLPLALAAVDGSRRPSTRILAGAGLAAWGLITGVVGIALAVLSFTPYDVARGNGNLFALWPATLVLVPYGVRLALNRVAITGLQRMRAFLVAICAPVVFDLIGHLIGTASQVHVPVMLVILAGHLLALAALRNVKPRESTPILVVDMTSEAGHSGPDSYLH